MHLKENFTFIDLFSGIGGFHCAMENYSNGQAKCIFASEINEEARKIYENYFGMSVHGDITKVKKEDIPGYFDVVCGGFPCQTFSKAGMQQGFGDPRGTLFKEIIRLIYNEDLKKQPKFLILENVRNLITHDNNVTWNTIKKALTDANYNVIDIPLVVGPKDFDIPQIRERAIIVAVRKDIYAGKIELTLPKTKNNSLSIYDVVTELSKEEQEKYKISNHEEKVLNCWDEFIKGIKFIPVVKKDDKGNKTYVKKEYKGVIGFPIWAFEFISRLKFNHEEKKYPDWKKEFILKNRHLYIYNKEFIDLWLKKWNKLKDFSRTERKMEWQCGVNNKSVWDGIIQFRPSGVRIKQPTECPTLVAMVHIPIIGKYKRYLTIKEAAKLQSFPDDYDFSKESKFNAYKQLGNAVNVKVIENTFRIFIDFINEKTRKKE